MTEKAAWQGDDRDRISSPHVEIGAPALGRLELRGDERVLGAAGFIDISAWLEPKIIAFDTREEMLDYIVVPYLRPARGWPEDEPYELASAVADRLGGQSIDYIRLNVTARRR